MVYGHNKTIHSTEHVDVEIHRGKVVSVWFRCARLPFEQHNVKLDRAKEMGQSYQHSEGDGRLVAVEFADESVEPAISVKRSLWKAFVRLISRPNK